MVREDLCEEVNGCSDPGKDTKAKMGEGRIHREGTAGAKVQRQDYTSDKRQCSWRARSKGEEMDLLYGYGGDCQNGHRIPATHVPSLL